MSNNNKVDIINNEDREHINSNNFQLLKNVNITEMYHKSSSNNNYNCLDYKFLIFNSVDDILYLVYQGDYKKNLIVIYDINDNKNRITIKYENYKEITNFRHYLDNIEKIDYVLASSSKNIVILNINDCSIVTKIDSQYGEEVCSACFINYNNNINIISSSGEWKGYSGIFNETIRGYDLKGKELNHYDSENVTYCIDSFHDKNKNKYFIIIGCEGYIKSYEYENKVKERTLRKYNCNKTYNYLYKSIIYDKNGKVKLIEPSTIGEIRIWDFYSSSILNKIKICSKFGMASICLWNSNNLFIACRDKTVKILNLNDFNNIESINHFINAVTIIQKVIHPKDGEFLITQETQGKFRKPSLEINLWKFINKH